eukprot:7441941-Alexandrium_andersonii.AAC.1
MSASLVGSEMCIRDRPRRCVASDPQVRFQLAACALPIKGRGLAADGSRCLLYTSDAADDM